MSDAQDLDAQPTGLDSAQEDTAAILSRRRFLVQSGLAGLGMASAEAAGATGCKKRPKPQLCLQPAPPPDAAPMMCLAKPLPRRAMPPPPAACLAVQVCLDAPARPRRRPRANPCLGLKRCLEAGRPPARPMETEGKPGAKGTRSGMGTKPTRPMNCLSLVDPRDRPDPARPVNRPPKK